MTVFAGSPHSIFSLGIAGQVLTFHTRARLSFAPPPCRMPLGQSQCIPQADPGGMATPRFWHRLIRFRHVISGSLALASLNHTCRNLVSTFPQRSPPLLLTTAACGGLRSTPDCRPRRTFLHLSYSYAPPCGPALLVTQDPYATLAVRCGNGFDAGFSPLSRHSFEPIQCCLLSLGADMRRREFISLLGGGAAAT